MSSAVGLLTLTADEGMVDRADSTFCDAIECSIISIEGGVSRTSRRPSRKFASRFYQASSVAIKASDAVESVSLVCVAKAKKKTQKHESTTVPWKMLEGQKLLTKIIPTIRTHKSLVPKTNALTIRPRGRPLCRSQSLF